MRTLRSTTARSLVLAAAVCLTAGCAKNNERALAGFLYAVGTKVDFVATSDGVEHETPKELACGEDVYKISSMTSGGSGSLVAVYSAGSSDAGTSDTTADFLWTEGELTAKVDGGGLTDPSKATTTGSAASQTMTCKFKLQFEAYSSIIATDSIIYTASGTAQVKDCSSFSCVVDGVAINCEKLNLELAKIRSCDDRDAE